MQNEVQIQAEEIAQLKHRLNTIYVKHTDQALENVERALDRDNFMTADAAKDFGIVDEVVSVRAPIEADSEDGSANDET